VVPVIPGPDEGNLHTHTILTHIFFMSLKLSLTRGCLKETDFKVCGIPGQEAALCENSQHKTGLVEWLKW
jgi:hypothetical protein